MGRVVVTGASGRLGRALVPQLAAEGLTPVAAGRSTGFDLTRPDCGGRAADAVLDGADVVVHAASDPRHAQQVDVAGTAHLLAAVKRHRVPQVVYVSIVGVDRTPFGYYRAKLAAERRIAVSGPAYTIVRGTQWFEFVTQIGALCGRFRAAPRGVVVAPSDVDEFAALITRRVLAGAQGATIEFGGPEQVALTLAAKQLSGHRVLHVGVPGALATALRAGSLLPGPGATIGSRSWSDWVARRP